MPTMPKSKQPQTTNEITAQTIRDILKYLVGKGCYAYRTNTLPVPVRGGGHRPGSLTGVCDITGILPIDDNGRLNPNSPRYGIYLGVETKTIRPKNPETNSTSTRAYKDTLRPEQIGFHKTISSLKGVIIIPHSLEDFISQFEKLFPL